MTPQIWVHSSPHSITRL